MPSTTLTIVPTVSLPKKPTKAISLINASISAPAPAPATPTPTPVINKKTISSPKKFTPSPSTSKRHRKPKTKQKTTLALDDAFPPSSSSSSSQTESDDTDKSTNTQKRQQQKQQKQPRRRQPKKPSAQPKLHDNVPPTLPVNMKRRRRSNSAVIYAGPHFMNDAPAPSSLPLPGALAIPIPSVSLHQRLPSIEQEKPQQYHHLAPLLQHRPTLYERSLASDYMDTKLLSSRKSYLMDPLPEIQEKLRIMLKIQA